MKQINNDTFELDDGLYMLGVHLRSECYPRVCIMHNPTVHVMSDKPLHWREDRQIFERICEHGAGHPDPDQFGYWKETNQEQQSIHGCDGCCTRKEVQ